MKKKAMARLIQEQEMALNTVRQQCKDWKLLVDDLRTVIKDKEAGKDPQQIMLDALVKRMATANEGRISVYNGVPLSELTKEQMMAVIDEAYVHIYDMR